jgi:hypothetical protein
MNSTCGEKVHVTPEGSHAATGEVLGFDIPLSYRNETDGRRGLGCS